MIYDFLRKTHFYGEVPNGFELRLCSREFRRRRLARTLRENLSRRRGDIPFAFSKRLVRQ